MDRVKESRDEEQETAQQLAAALEKFSVVINFKGGEPVSVETDVASLIREMEASINEADGFIKTMASSN